jgi:hypothetical protein
MDMPVVFEPDIHFEAADNTAVVWGDGDNGKRFRLTISRRALTDKYGYKGKHFDNKAAEALIRDRWNDIEKLAQEAHSTGQQELDID